MENSLLKDVVYHRIKELITSGFFQMGSKLSEGTLEETLGSNKAPIRDALKRLQAEGLVVRKAKSGTYVFSLDPGSFKELLRYRYALESTAYELCLQTSTSGQLVVLETALLSKMETAFRSSDSITYFQLDSSFHENIVNLCGNRFLIRSYANIKAVMDTVRNYHNGNASDLHSSITEHQQLISCLQHRNLQGGIDLLKQHLLPEHGAFWKPANLLVRLH